jgi:hypothetical protein
MHFHDPTIRRVEKDEWMNEWTFNVILDAQNEIMSFWGMNENFESTSSTTDNNMMIQQKRIFHHDGDDCQRCAQYFNESVITTQRSLSF